MDEKIWIEFIRQGLPVVQRLVSIIPEIGWQVNFPDQPGLKTVSYIVYNLNRNDVRIEVYCE